MHASQIIAAHPDVCGNVNVALLRCLEACHSCAQACTACADACLAEEAVAALRDCIRLTLDCADLCATIGRIATRGTGVNGALLAEILNTCALVCRFCGAECDRHARRHEHCRICAEACRRCAEACGEAIRALREA